MERIVACDLGTGNGSASRGQKKVISSWRAVSRWECYPPSDRRGHIGCRPGSVRAAAHSRKRGRRGPDGAARGGEDRVPLWRVVPSRGIHRDQPGDGQPGGGAIHNKRGTAEQWIKEGKQAVKMTRLSCHRFRSNDVRLWLSRIAYNLGNLWRRLVLPKKIENWSLTSLQQRLVKTGGRLVKHARYYWLMLAESHLTRRLFGSMVRRLAALAVATG